MGIQGLCRWLKHPTGVAPCALRLVQYRQLLQKKSAIQQRMKVCKRNLNWGWINGQRFCAEGLFVRVRSILEFLQSLNCYGTAVCKRPSNLTDCRVDTEIPSQPADPWQTAQVLTKYKKKNSKSASIQKKNRNSPLNAPKRYPGPLIPCLHSDYPFVYSFFPPRLPHKEEEAFGAEVLVAPGSPTSILGPRIAGWRRTPPPLGRPTVR